MGRRPTAIILIAILLAAASAGSARAALSQADIKTLMTGSTIELTNLKGFPIRLSPKPGGKLEFRVNKRGKRVPKPGKWWTKPGKFCFQIPDIQWMQGQVRCPTVATGDGGPSFINAKGDSLPWKFTRAAAPAGGSKPGLGKAEIESLMTDSRISLVNKKGNPVRVTFRDQGVAEFESTFQGQPKRFPGVWFAKPGQVCFQIPQAKMWKGERKCLRVTRAGDRIKLSSVQGEPLPWQVSRAPAPKAAVARVSHPSATPVRDAAGWQSEIEFGNFHAVVIGNNAYRNISPLKTAVDDAKAVARVLRREYGFTVHLLLDATRRDILKKFAELRKTLTEGDNLLIYYAGHGILDEDAERGYWLPVDADEDIKDNWISNIDITDSLKAMDAWHVLVVADSCYSGTLVRSGNRAIRGGGDRAQLIKRLAIKRSRTVLTSGGLEPVVDAGGSGHSVFAQAFIDTLRDNGDVLEGQEMFTRLRQKVILNADQTPEYSDVRKAGHDGGDFVFVRTVGR